MRRLTFAIAAIAAMSLSGSVLAGPNDPAPVPSATQTKINGNLGTPALKMTTHRAIKHSNLKIRRHVRLTRLHDRGLHKGFSHSRHLGYAKAGQRDINMGMKVHTKAKVGTR